MTHPLFSKDIFVETAFEKRFQAMLRSAWHKRSWHVIVADPGAGKTMGIRDLLTTAGSKAVLAITAPKNNADEMALGNQLFTALGLPLRGRWSDRKPKLMGHLYQYQTSPKSPLRIWGAKPTLPAVEPLDEQPCGVTAECDPQV